MRGKKKKKEKREEKEEIIEKLIVAVVNSIPDLYIRAYLLSLDPTNTTRTNARLFLFSLFHGGRKLADSYQYQLQSMWQKCWNTNQSLVHNLRFRERGPLKSWRPETMAEAIFSVLKEGLSLSQAAR